MQVMRRCARCIKRQNTLVPFVGSTKTLPLAKSDPFVLGCSDPGEERVESASSTPKACRWSALRGVPLRVEVAGRGGR